MTPSRISSRAGRFSESVIREMTRVARQHDAVNLAQGFPDFPAPDLLKEAACRAIRADVNQYAVTWGTPRLRMALARRYQDAYGLEVDPDREIVVTCGATEAMAAVFLALFDPGDEVLIPEPFYENYGPDAILAGATPVYVPLEEPDLQFDADAFAHRITPKTRAIVLNTPNNPTGRVFTRTELEAVARLCRTHGLIAITDEIYEYITYGGEHLSLATFDGMRDRTVIVSGASKTFAVTGWRVGTIVAPPDITVAVRAVHDFLTVGAPAPLQEAVAEALETLGEEYYGSLGAEYRERRDVLVPGLREVGFQCRMPEGAYYVMADISALAEGADDVAFSHRLVKEAGVAPVPGSSFFSTPDAGRHLVRFAFCKRLDTLAEAVERLARFSRLGS